MLCSLQPIQFYAFALNPATGVEEQVTEDIIFSSSNQSILLIGALSGNATAVGDGIVTVTAVWQGLMAFAQVNVIGAEDCCDNTKVGIAFLVDNSWSMNGPFSHLPVPPGMGGGSYPTKLAYAKALTTRFCSELDLSKDTLELLSFNSGATLLQEVSEEWADYNTAINGITYQEATTNLKEAIEAGISRLAQQATITLPVIVLLSDGEDHGEDPVPLADQFKAGGGIIVVVGIRAHEEGYALLSKIASGGFFLSAHHITLADASATDTFDYLSGIKGYFCAGECRPPTGTAFLPALNYTGFQHWDITREAVDLIGGIPPFEFFNLLPGNGLYVDLAGSGFLNAPGDPPTGGFRGEMTTKDSFEILQNNTIGVSVYLAGNQRADVSGYIVYCEFRDAITDQMYKMQTWSIDDFNQDFTLYTTDYTPTEDKVLKIAIGMMSYPTDEPANAAFGILMDSVQITNQTSNDILLEDDFDGENEMSVISVYANQCDPVVGDYSAVYTYGCGRYCMDRPVPQQIEDTEWPYDPELAL